MVLASFCAFGVNYLVSDTLSNHFFTCEKHSSYWEALCTSSLAEFRQYVTDNHLTREQALSSGQLGSSDSEIVLYYEQFPSIDIENEAQRNFLEEHRDNIITCTDGIIYATSYSPGRGYRMKWKVRGMVAGTTCASTILLVYIIHLLRRIKTLHRQILDSKQGDRSTIISIGGHDEIFELGQIIESMRTSLWDLLEQEKQSRQSQNQLIAALSHDIRTPLTKLTGYLEILAYHKVSAPQDQENYLGMALEKARQLRSLTDKLLNCTSVKGKLVHDDRELVNGPEFLSQILYESCYELEIEGFRVDQPQLSGDYVLNIQIGAFQRVCDNLSSNISKYADPSIPIRMEVCDDPYQLHLNVTNHKAKIRRDVPSHGLGLPSAKELMERMGGTLEVCETVETFTVRLTIPKVVCDIRSNGSAAKKTGAM